MGIIKKWLIGLVGKKLDANMGKWGISKTKVVSIIGAIIAAYGIIGPTFQLPPIPKEVLEFLGAVGLWTLRDAVVSVPPPTIPPSA